MSTPHIYYCYICNTIVYTKNNHCPTCNSTFASMYKNTNTYPPYILKNKNKPQNHHSIKEYPIKDHIILEYGDILSQLYIRKPTSINPLENKSTNKPPNINYTDSKNRILIFFNYLYSEVLISNFKHKNIYSHKYNRKNYEKDTHEQNYKRDYDDYSNIECSICLCIVSNMELKVVFNCKHIFHKECIIDWIKNNKICPNCRYKIK